MCVVVVDVVVVVVVVVVVLFCCCLFCFVMTLCLYLVALQWTFYALPFVSCIPIVLLCLQTVDFLFSRTESGQHAMVSLSL